MKKYILILSLSFIPCVLLAQTPRTMSYQGMISGGRIAGECAFKVTLYADAEGKTKLWQSTMKTVLDTTGIFNLVLGTPDNPLPESPAMDRPLWIGVSIDGSPELTPRAQFTASPYALNV